ncbi:MAG: ATP-grasp domain-containing protein [Myxococcota bacterium]
MNVLFLSPAFPVEMNDYVRALARTGARVLGVADRPESELPADTRDALTAYLKVDRVLDAGNVLAAVRHWMQEHRIRFDRIEALWEPLVLVAAELREALSVPGMSVDVSRRFRDKEAMKRMLRDAGLRVPRSSRETSRQGVIEAATAIGYPVIVKPIAGAGSADTYRVDHPDAWSSVLDRLGHVPEVSVEEFIDGEEFTYDTLCVDGVPVYENVAEYLPRPLIARTHEHRSPIIITRRDLDHPHLTDGIALGRAVLSVLGMQTGLTHMEWYRTASGEAVFGEIGCRPPGAHLVDQMNFSHDGDLYLAWAQAVTGTPLDPLPPRSHACAIVFKRAHGSGHISRVEGLADFLAEYGEHVVWQGLAEVGTPRRDWRQTLVSDGFLIVRHPEESMALKIARLAADRVQLYARDM